MIKEREANSWKSVSYAKSISGVQTYTKFPIVLRTTEQSIPTWNVKGNMQQSGTPTPTSPITPSECGERTENLANENNLDLQKWISSSGTISDNPNGTIFKGKIAITTTNYTVKATTNQSDVAGIGAAIYNSNDEFIRREYSASLDKTLTFATTTGDNYFKIIVSTRDTPTESLIKSLSVMANEGLTALPYEPYGYKLPVISGNTTTNIYLSEPLRSFLGYTDTINSDGTVTRRIKKKVFTGEEPVNGVRLTFDENNYCASYRFDAIGMEDIIDYEEKMTTISYPKYVSTHLVNKNDAYQLYYTIFDGQMGANDTGSTGNARNRYIIVCVAGLTTAADYQAWFAQQYANGTPVEVYYILATPTTETTTTSAIPTTSGLNTIDVNTTLKPSEMSLTYDGYKLCKRQRYSRTENLFDKDNDVEKFYVRASDGTYKKSTGNSYSAIIPCVAGTAYTITTISKTLRVGFYATKPVDGTSCIESFNNNNSSYASRSVTYTASTNATYMAIYAYQDGDEYSDGKTLEDIYGVLIVNTGSTAKPYQPYLDWE